jgi:hypothetical protein
MRRFETLQDDLSWNLGKILGELVVIKFNFSLYLSFTLFSNYKGFLYSCLLFWLQFYQNLSNTKS